MFEAIDQYTGEPIDCGSFEAMKTRYAGKEIVVVAEHGAVYYMEDWQPDYVTGEISRKPNLYPNS